MKKSLLFFFLFAISVLKVSAQGNNCASATPFCTAVGTPFTFPNNTNTTAQTGPQYGCLGSEPNPEWFFLQTTAAGNMNFTISQTTPGGSSIDVDFIAWGPFSSMINACNSLTGSCSPGGISLPQTCTGNIEDCSYSTAGVEQMNLLSPGPGNFFVIMITNYDGAAGNISFTQNSGPGTNCNITCPSVLSGPGFVVSPGGASMPASVACNSPNINLIASSNTPFGNPITPAIIFSFNDNANTSNWVQWLENGVFQLCAGPAANGCGTSLTINSNNDIQISTISPSATNNFVLCENNTAQPNMPYGIGDAASGTVLNTGTWVDDGSCQTISFPPGTISGVSSWSISPACAGCLATTDWGFATFNPSAAGPGTYNICYSFDPPGSCPTYNYCQSITVTNPYNATWTAPAALCANSAAISLTSLLSGSATAGGTWSGTGVSGTNFNPATSGPGTFTITYTVGSGACSATQSHTITVNPVPVATATPTSQTLCSGGATSIALSSTVAGTTYSWTVVQTNVSGATAGSGSSIAQTLTATGTTAGTAVYTITPTAGGCTGTPITVTITVNPKPVVTATPASQTICSGSATGISLTSTVAGTTFSWTVVQTNVSGASAGSGSSIAQTLTATSTVAGTAVYTVTPTAAGCTGTPITVTITVNPKPVATATPTAQTICSGTAPSIALTSNVAGTTFSWTVVQTNVSGASASSGSTISQTLTATSTVAGTAVYTITPTAGGCAGTPITVTITVNPTPVVTATPTSQTLCSGGTTGITLSSTVAGTTFAWTVTQTNVSGAVAGSGSSIAQTLTATSTVAGTAVYTITPTANGCSGTPITVTITVNPTPVATATPSAQTICSGTATSIALSSNVVGTTYSWTVVQTNVSGASAGSGSSIAQTLNATATVAGTAVYTITPTANGCPGTPITVTITVNPSPVATATPSSQTICSGSATGISLSSNVAGATFAWTVVQTNVSGASAGSGSTIAQTLTATGTTAGTAVYTITPTANGCSGTPITVTITVNPKPVATATPSSQTICSGTASSIALTSNVAGTTFSWTVSMSGVTGATAGSGSSIAQVLTTTGTTAGSATYTITPTAAGCTGTPISVTITVNPVPVVTATPTSQTICSGSSTGISLTGNVVGTTFSWTVVQTNVSGATAGSGSSIIQPLTATSTVAGTAVYTITPTATGCPGTPITVTITVNPTPVVTATPSSQTFCTGGTTGITLTSGVAGTTFGWTVVQTGVAGASAGSGSNIAQTLTTTGAVAGTAVYTITPTANGCPGTPITVTITVNPRDNASFTYSSSTYCQTGTNPSPTITGLAGGTFTSTPAGLSINSSTGLINLLASTLGTYTVTYTTSGICPNTSSVAITITSAPSASFSYPGSPFCQYGANPFPTFGAGASAGTFSATPAGLNFVNVNTGQINVSTSTPGTYTVTNSIAASGGCAPATATSTVTISPAPVVTATPASQTICSGTATGIVLSSSLGGTTYSWTITQTGASGASAGSGSSITQTLTATGTTAGTVVYSVTPTSGGCVGLPINVTITVNPTPVATASPTAQIICSGSAPLISLSSTVAGTTYSWTVVQTNVSGATAGSGSTIAQTLTATSTVAGTAVYTVTPSASGCAGAPITVTITVNPNPVVTATPSTQTICSGSSSSISLSSSVAGTTYSWTVVQTGVSVAANGTGSSIAQTLTTTGSVAGAAVYTITPTANGCPGTPITATVTVNPIPTVTATPATQTICSGSTASTSFTSVVAGTSFAWTVVQTGVTGASAGSGSSISQALTATGSVAGTAVYTITPSAGGCSGTPTTFTVTVNPTPVATATPSVQTICSGSTTAISLSSTVAGTSFSWTVVQTGVSGALAASGSSIAQTLTATGSSAGTAVYTITPSASGCLGTPITVTITVNPTPFVTASPAAQTICSGATTGITLSSFTAGTTYSWTVVQTGVTGASAGSGSTIAQTLTNTGSVAGTAVYTVTPTANGCPGSPITVTITVNPKPVATATPSAQTICSGSTASTTLTSTVAGTTFSWTVVQSGVSGASAGSGASISQVLTATGSSPGTATYTITPSASGCAGLPVTFTVTVNPIPVAVATPALQTICSGSTTSINLSSAVAGTTYSWTVVETGVSGAAAGSGSSIAQVITNSGTTAGTAVYSITPSANGCSGSPITVTVTVNPTPVATATPSSQTICSGTAPSVVLSSPVSGTTFNWTVTQTAVTGASAGSGSTIAQSLTATSTVAGTAVYTVTPTASGCPGSPISVNITVNPLPVVTATPTSQTLCDGGQTSISLSTNVSGTTLNWTVSQTGVTGAVAGGGTTSIADILNVTGPATGTAVYTITPTAAGCDGSPINVTITVNPIDDATFTYPGSTFCQTGTDPSATITGLPGGTFSVSPSGLVLSNASTGLLDLSSSIPGTYSVTYQTNGNCPNSSTISLTITNAPTADFTYTTPLCSSDANPLPTFISGSSAGLFSSTSGLSFVSTNTGEIDMAASTPGSYVVVNTIAAAGGCAAATASANITIDQAATVSAGPDNSVCEASVYTLAGSFGGSASAGVWTTSGSGIFSNPTSPTSQYTPSAADVTAGAVTLTFTTDDPSGVCGSVADSMVLNITPLDNSGFNYGSGTTFCHTGVNPVPTITGLAGGVFSASSPSVVFVSTSTGEINLLSSGLGTFDIYYTTNGTCPHTDTVSVTLTNSPSATFSFASGATAFCQTSPDPSPLFTGGASGGIFTASPAGLMIDSLTGAITLSLAGSLPGTYMVTNTIAASGGCATAVDSLQITIDQAPLVEAGAGASICAGSVFTVSGDSIGGSATSVTWTSSGTGTFSAPSSLTTIYTPSAADTTAGTVTLYLTTDDPAGACGAVTDSVIVIINQTPPAPTVSNTSIFSCFGSGATPITATGTGPGSSFTWYSDAALTTPLSTTNPFNPGVMTATTSYWVAETMGTCQGPATQVTITVNPLPVADTISAVVTAADCGTPTGSVMGIVMSSGAAPYTYQWQDASGTSVGTSIDMTGVGPGAYSLTVTDANGCSSVVGPFNVMSTSGVTASFTASPTTGETPLLVNFTNTSTGATSYLWGFDPFGLADTSTAVNPTYTIVPLGNFMVCLVASNAAGCADTACTNIDVYINSVFVIPNIFTPNDDGVNDIFGVMGVGLATMDAEIYNRWGQKMYEWHTINGGWDGRTTAGVVAPDGTYYYIIKATGIDGKEYEEKGSFSLVR